MTKPTTTIVAATAGYSVAWFADNPARFEYSPVVAWRVVAGIDLNQAENITAAFPVTLGESSHDLSDIGNWNIIRDPSGAYHFMGDDKTCPDEESALAFAKETLVCDECRAKE